MNFDLFENEAFEGPAVDQASLGDGWEYDAANCIFSGRRLFEIDENLLEKTSAVIGCLCIIF